MNTNIRSRTCSTTSALTLAALLATTLLTSCAADPEKARYIGNNRVIGNYTESQVQDAAAGTAGVAAYIIFKLFTGGHFEFGDCD